MYDVRNSQGYSSLNKKFLTQENEDGSPDPQTLTSPNAVSELKPVKRRRKKPPSSSQCDPEDIKPPYSYITLIAMAITSTQKCNQTRQQLMVIFCISVNKCCTFSQGSSSH